MSFDVFLISFRDGKNAPANAEAARAVLLSSDLERESDKDCHFLKFPDRSGVELYSDVLGPDNKFDGGMFALRSRGFSREVMNFIHKFAAAAGCAIFSGDGGTLRDSSVPGLGSALGP